MDSYVKTIYAETTVILLWVLFVMGVSFGIYVGYVTVNCRPRQCGQSENVDVEAHGHINMLAVHKELEAEKAKLEREMKKQVEKLEKDLRDEQRDKDEALRRLSELMSSRLRDGNANIADLSDENRPTKLAEQFSELYDNQWTNAYDAIENQLKGNNENISDALITKTLLDILQQSYDHCKKRSEKQLEGITKMFSKGLPRDNIMQRIKEERKRSASENIPDFDNAMSRMKSHLKNDHKNLGFLETEPLALYLRECLKLCWLAVVQDPPMTLEFQLESSANGNYKAYKHRGKHIAFIVWPALFLHTGGSLLAKGVAEFTEIDPNEQFSINL